MAAGWKIWIEAARPKTLPAAVVPVAVGTAFAYAQASADWFKAANCLAFALLVQIGTNFANDYFDFQKGADTPERVGPRRAVAAGLIAPSTMLGATALVLGVALGVGLLLAYHSSWLLVPVGLASLVCAVAYTGGPYPLGYHGFGDLFVYLFFGLVAVGATFYVQTGMISPAVGIAASAIGLLAVNILVVNNYRDADTDARAGKRTLVVRYGRKFAVWQYGVGLFIALLSPPVLHLYVGHGWPVLLPLTLTPWAVGLTWRLARSMQPAEQIVLLGASARFLAAYGALLCVGAIWGV